MTTSARSTKSEAARAVVGDKLGGKVALVTGGTRGIGSAISASLASQGAAIAAGYSGNTTRAQQFKDEFSDQFHTPVTVHQGNVGSGEDCRRVIAEVIDQHGRLDVLVNNAGITGDKTVLNLTDDDWHKVLAVNLSGAFFLSQAALAHMTDRGTGRIINVSSIIGEIGNIGQANYAASKSGLFGLTKTLAREAAFLLERSGKLTEDSIGVTVTPGYILTEMVAAVPEKVLNKIKAQIPVRRLGRPRRSPASCTSSPPKPRHTSPAKSGPSTAEWTCDLNRGRTNRPRPAGTAGGTAARR